MRCRNCGKEMLQTGAISTILPNGRYEVTKKYMCRKCGHRQEVKEVRRMRKDGEYCANCKHWSEAYCDLMDDLTEPADNCGLWDGVRNQ